MTCFRYYFPNIRLWISFSLERLIGSEREAFTCKGHQRPVFPDRVRQAQHRTEVIAAIIMCEKHQINGPWNGSVPEQKLALPPLSRLLKKTMSFENQKSKKLFHALEESEGGESVSLQCSLNSFFLTFVKD